MGEKHSCQTNHDEGLGHHHSVFSEIICHLPYAIFSVALSMIFLSLLSFFAFGRELAVASYRLFHNFHFIHILFAGTGTMLTFRRFSKNVFAGIAIGSIVPSVFCTISDAFLPYLGGKMVGLDMHFHWCFLSHLSTVIPFLVGGMINGWAISRQTTNVHLFYSLGFHFMHIFVSSMASILYLVSFGFVDWWSHMGVVFIYIIFAVLIPCTLSDLVVPMMVARPLWRWKKT